MRPHFADIEACERDKYQSAWTDAWYRKTSHGLDLIKACPELFDFPFSSMLDIGCGHGRAMAHFCREGVDAYGIDIVDALDDDIREEFGARLTVEPLWRMDFPMMFDLGLCTDVMEHIPESLVELSLEQIGSFCHKTIFKIANFKHEFQGNTLHMTLHPVDWWVDRMTAIKGVAREISCLTNIPDFVIQWDAP